MKESRLFASQIKLSTKSFGAGAAEVAARAIMSARASLTAADLSDVIAGASDLLFFQHTPYLGEISI